MRLCFPVIYMATVFLVGNASSHLFRDLPLSPGFRYLEFLDFNIHNDCMMPVAYSIHHFWNHMAILQLSLTPEMTEAKRFINWLSCRLETNQQPAGLWEASVDESSVDDFNVFLSQIIIKPFQPYPQLYSTVEFKTRNEVFYHEFLLWGMPRCVVDMYVRNLLIIIYRFLCEVFDNLFDKDNLHYHFTLLYNALTNHNRFAQCGDRNTYSNWLALADAAFCLVE